MSDSIAVVVLDAVRADYFYRYFDWIPGEHYKNVYSTSHWTIPAHASLFTGLMPRETGTYAGSPSFNPPVTSLAEQMKESGYSTALYTANIQLTQWEGWSRGFGTVKGDKPRNDLFNWLNAKHESKLPHVIKYPELITKCILSDSDTFPSLKEGWRIFRDKGGGYSINEMHKIYRKNKDEDDNNPSFTFINLMDAHSSIGVPLGNSIAQDNINEKKIQTEYSQAISDLSKNYKDFFDELYSDFDWVITMSDHGELLGEYGLTGHGYGLHPELVQVPLVISNKNTNGIIEDESLSSIVDVTATIRKVAGLERIGRGEPLQNDISNDTVLVERLGQPHLTEDMFYRNGILDKFEEYDTELRGFAVEGRGYFYEDKNGVKKIGDWSDNNIKEKINELFKNIKILKRGNNPTVSDEVKKKLRDLGYA